MTPADKLKEIEDLVNSLSFEANKRLDEIEESENLDNDEYEYVVAYDTVINVTSQIKQILNK